jgi:hypothetical protein
VRDSAPAAMQPVYGFGTSSTAEDPGFGQGQFPVSGLACRIP